MEKERITNYAEFWDFYVQEHLQPLTRLLHFVGYGFSWFSHFFVEKNKPASFQYPLWSFISDYKMMFYMLIGKMNTEVERVLNK
jgi:hypothetical protein